MDLWAEVGVQRMKNRARKETKKKKFLILLFNCLYNSAARLKFSNRTRDETYQYHLKY